MKKLFGKRKKDEGALGPAEPRGGAPPTSSPAAPQSPVPPLPLQQAAGGGGATPSYNSAGYLQPPYSGGPNTGRSSGGGPLPRTVSRTQSGLSRTQSGVSSGRRSARRPREYIDLSQPEQVDGSGQDDCSVYSDEEGSWEEGGWEGDRAAAAALPPPAAQQPGPPSAEQEQLDADLALAYQLAMQDQLPGPLAEAAPPQPPPPPWEAALQQQYLQQQQQYLQQQPAAPAYLPPAASLPQQHSAPIASPRRQIEGPASLPTADLSLPAPHVQPARQPRRSSFLQSLSLSLSRSSKSFRSDGTAQQAQQAQREHGEDLALASALAESQFAAAQQAEWGRQQDSMEAQYQAAISQALEESMVTVNYDDLLRDIQLWIYDLEGASGDVNKALEEAHQNVEEVNRQMAAADPEDAAGWHRIVWLSEQYPLVEERLREVGSRVAPVNDAVRGLKELCDFIRADQPPLADAEQLRDSLISRMFDDLGRQGLDANHPFAAYGDKEEAPRPGRLKSLLSLGRTPSVDKAPRGGDLRDMVRHMIEEARRIPEPPPLPVDYGPLLEELRRWVEAAEAANRDVDAATQDVRQQHDSVEALKAEAMEDVFDPTWHRLAFLSEQYPLAEARLADLLARIGATNMLASTLRNLIKRIETEKPPLADAEAARDVAISTLFSDLGANGLDTASLPATPQSSDMRDVISRAIEEAKRIPEVPPLPVNYGGVLAAVRDWIQQLEATSSAVAAVQRDLADKRGEADAQKGGLAEDAFDPVWHRLAFLSEQYPLAEARVAGVAGQAEPAQAALQSLRALERRIEAEQPPLEEVEASLETAVAVLLADLGERGLDAASLPTPTRGSHVHDLVGRALEEARRLPEVPPVPVNYSSLLASLRDWIEQLEATNADVAATRQELEHARGQNDAQKAAAVEDVFDPTWHRLAFLSEQYPLAEGRVQGVAGQAAPTGPALSALRALERRIEAERPPLEEAQGELGAVVSTLLSGLGGNGLDTASLPSDVLGSDVRGLVGAALEQAKRLPKVPPVPVNYSGILAAVRDWIEQLEATNADLSGAEEEVAGKLQEATARKAAVSPKDREGAHLAAWLCEQYPLAQQRLGGVVGQLQPAHPALDALRALERRIEAEQPPLEEAQGELDSTIAALLSGLGGNGLDTASLPPAPAPADVRALAGHAIDEAKRIPEAPPLPPIDYGDLLGGMRRWIEECRAALADTQAAQEAVVHAQAAVKGRLRKLKEDEYDPDWHNLSWESQQYPAMQVRLKVVDGQAAPCGAAAQALEALLRRIEEEQMLPEDAQAAFAAASAALVAELRAQGLDTASLPEAPEGSDVRDMVRRAIEEARRIPAAPPVPVNYTGLIRAIRDWIEQLEGAGADAAAAGKELAGQRAEAEAQKAGLAADVFDPTWHRLAFLSEQYPLAEARVAGVGGQAEPAGPAVAALRALLRRIETEQPPLEEAQGELGAVVSTLLQGLGSKGLDTASLPEAARGSDVRGLVGAALEQAKRLPEVPPLPVNYGGVLASLRDWIQQLEATNADVAAARQELAGKREKNEAERAGVKEDTFDPTWHKLAWLSQQIPLAEERVDGVAGKASPAHPALDALRALERRIEAEQPPLEEAQAELDSTIAALLSGLGGNGLDTASLPQEPRGSDVRGMVDAALKEAKRLPPPPPLPTNYASLLEELERWISDLEGVASDLDGAQKETRAAREANDLEKAGLEEDPFDEAYHRLAFLSKEYPLAEGRLRDVGLQLQPTQAALQTLRDLKRQIEKKKPSLKQGQEAFEAAIAALVRDLGKRGFKVRHPPAVSSDVREVAWRAIERAKRLPTPPRPPPRPPSLAPRPPRVKPPIEPPKFRVPNLTEPRPRRKSRGVRPAPEDAIKRDPRVIALYNEMSQGRGIVPVTVAWDEVHADMYGDGKRRRRSSGGGGAAATPSPRGAATPPASARGSATPPASARGAAAASASPATPAATPSPRRALGSASPSPSPAAPAEPEMSAEEAAAYLPTLAARGAAIAAFQPETLQQVADFVADVRAQGGDAPCDGHAAVAFPRGRWRLLCEAADAFDGLLDMCDAMHNWQCDLQASVIAESHRLSAYIDSCAAAVSRVQYPYDPLRQRMAKAGIPWDTQLLTDLRWASQRAAVALMQHALDWREDIVRAKGWNTGAVLQPLGSAAIGAFKVHQFCGGFNNAAEAAYDQLHEHTVHYARMLDPQWLRNTKWA